MSGLLETFGSGADQERPVFADERIRLSGSLVAERLAFLQRDLP
jgi:hypothetical protein